VVLARDRIELYLDGLAAEDVLGSEISGPSALLAFGMGIDKPTVAMIAYAEGLVGSVGNSVKTRW
jgi:hypothetical protein